MPNPMDVEATAAKLSDAAARAQKLLHQRRYVKGRVTLIANQLGDISQVSSCAVLRVASNRLRDLLVRLESTNLELEAEDSAYINEGQDMEQRISELEAAIQERLDEMLQSQAAANNDMTHASFVTTASTPDHKPHLPQVSLPKFNGKYADWMAFKDLFMVMVHKNNDLSPVQKFYYLKSCLLGEAAGLVNTLDCTSDNYSKAWLSLTARYDNKVLICSNFMQNILTLPKVNKNYSLRQLLNEFTQYHNSILSLNISDLADTLFIHILSSKLDYGSLRDFELQRDSTEFPKLTEFSSFLQQRCQALEMVCRDGSSSSLTVANPVSTVKCLHATANQQSGKFNCLFCDKNNHSMTRCFKFLKQSPSERIKFVEAGGMCVLCLSHNHNLGNCTRNVNCKVCQQRHHHLLHVEVKKSYNATTNNNNTSGAPPKPTVVMASCLSNQMEFCEFSLLPTACAYVSDRQGNKISCRLLLDAGSQKNYITSDFAHKVGMFPSFDVDFIVAGVGGHTSRVRKGVELAIFSNVSNFNFKAKFGVLESLTDSLPTTTIAKSIFRFNNSLRLADPDFHISNKIDMVLGANCFAMCILEGKLCLGPGLPTLLNTTFGWVVCGDVSIADDGNISHSRRSACFLSQLHNDIQKFWQLDEVPNKPLLTFQEQQCERVYQGSVTRTMSGRYCVALPIKEELLPDLGKSYDMALSRLFSLEKKFLNNPSFYTLYKDFINEYVKLGHAHYIPTGQFNNGALEYIMPHHAVLKESSSTTKLRVVFNASAPTTTGLSLNSILMVGPTVQSDMWSILLQFRTHPIAFISDINKMYRQIQVKSEHQPLQRILWRESPSQEVQCLQLSTVTYGTAAASFLSTRTLVQLVKDEGEGFPSASKAILTGTYVDDILYGAKDVSSALNCIDELNRLLGLGEFQLHKWYSNSSELLTHIPLEKREKCKFSFNYTDNSSLKTLGLKWDPSADCFQVSIPDNLMSKKPTKRNVLSDIAKVYDPLGFIAPVTVSAKLIMQSIWKENIEWDSIIPLSIQKIWNSFCANLHFLNAVSVPRLMIPQATVKVELHGFADSSSKAYGCVIFARCSLANLNTVHFVTSKSRVAPLKTVTLARLELCSSLLLARHMSNVAKILNINQDNLFYWTDSQITLCWIKGDPGKRDVFVAHRVAEIQNLTSPQNWSHVTSSENPADVVSRGIQPQNLSTCKIWFEGPPWLSLPRSEWPVQGNIVKPSYFESDSVKEIVLMSHKVDKLNLTPLFERFSSWSKLVRLIAYVLRVKRLLGKGRSLFLTSQELMNSSKIIIRCVQQAHFPHEIQVLSSKDSGKMSNFSFKQMKYLNIFLDEDGLLRVGGRLRHSSLQYNHKFPFLLPAHAHVTDLIIKYEHERLLHAGMQTTLSSLRKFVWPLNGRNRVRHLIHKCVRCFRFSGETASQMMADLPKYRVSPYRPFLITGIDFAGPFSIKVARIRKPIVTKGYICLYVCLSTKAIHIELVSDLTTKEFLNSLRRFIARRGKCSEIFSDNGTTFQGAKNELNALHKMFKNDFENISNFLSVEGIQWKFIVPNAPHWGGIWESSVKLVKHHLKRVMGNTVLSYEHFNTLLTQIEAIVNSRPITPLRDEASDDNQCLTPAHFLIGESLTAFPEGNVADIPDNRLDIYKQICKLRQKFWKGWKADYLNTLQVRYKWYKEKPDVLLNSIVLLKDDNHPPLSWPLGLVTEVFYGKDNHIRAVTVKTKTGHYNRPITKIVPLPFNN